MTYASLTPEQRAKTLSDLMKEYEAYREKNLKLDMSRGIPSPEQLNLTLDMLHNLNSAQSCKTDAGLDCRS